MFLSVGILSIAGAASVISPRFDMKVEKQKVVDSGNLKLDRSLPPSVKNYAPASEENGTVIFYEDFESAEGDTAPYSWPEGWTTVATPGYSAGNWLVGTLGNAAGPMEGISGYKYACILPSGDHKLDCWMNTKKFHLEAGKSYDLYFFYFAPNSPFEGGGPADLQVDLFDSKGNKDQNIFELGGYVENDQHWNLARRSFTVSKDGEYYMGFHCQNPENGYVLAIDNIRLSPSGPYLFYIGNGNVAGALDFQSLDNYSTATNSFFLTNVGGEPVHVEVDSKPDYIELSGFPSDFMGVEQFEVTVDGQKAPLGETVSEIILSTNDPAYPIITVLVRTNVKEAKIVGYKMQDFERGAIEGWNGWFCYSEYGVDNTRCMGQWTVSPGWLETGYINMGDNPVFSFDYKAREYTFIKPESQKMPTPASQVKIRVFASTDFGRTWEQVYAILPEGGDMVHTPIPDYIHVNVPIDKYAGKTCKFSFRYDAPMFLEDYFLTIDNVGIGTPAANDLAAECLTGPATPVVGETASYFVRVKNLGTKQAEGYSIDILDKDGNNVTTKSAEAIPAGKTATINFDWTPTNAGPQEFTAVAKIAGDGDESNNRTLPRAIYAQNVNAITKDLGSLYNRTDTLGLDPLCFYYKKSDSQTIYPANLVGTSDAEITAITYRISAKNEKFTGPVRFLIGETEKTDYSDGQPVSADNMTEVVATSTYIPAGVNEITFAFNKPYHYRGGNLVIEAIKEMDEWWDDCHFVCNGRKKATYCDFVSIDTPETDVMDIAPAVRINMTIGEVGALHGTVKDSDGKPVAGVTVNLDGTGRTSISRETGAFEFANVAVGANKVRTEAYGFYSAESNAVQVEKGQDVVADLVLNKLPRHSLTGTITDAAGAPISGAKVKSLGYYNGYAYSDKDGKYSIDGVIATSSDVINYEVSAPWYDNVSGVKVSANDKDSQITKDFTLKAETLPVRNLKASADVDNVKVSWDAPAYEFRYDDGGEIIGQIGFNFCYENSEIGVVYRNIAELDEIKWYLTEEGGPHDKVNIRVYSLDENGEPTEKVLFEAIGVESTDNQWNTLVIDRPVKCPDGFILAIGSGLVDCFVGLARTSDTEKNPFGPGMYYDHHPDMGDTWRDLYPILEYETPFALSLRAVGKNLGELDFTKYTDNKEIASVNPSAPVVKYQVSRISDKETVVIGTIDALELSDLPQSSGKYRYLVKAVYAGEQLSEGKTSNEVLFNSAGVDNINSDKNETYTVYNTQGILILNQGTRGDLLKLPSGLYIINGKTQVLK